MGERIDCLDHGYVELVESWGSDERIIEAARMSTGGGFKGWGPTCPTCGGDRLQMNPDPEPSDKHDAFCNDCRAYARSKPGDEKLLRYLWENKHTTPFEMAGLSVEVRAPIFVYRQWHRHRTQCLSPDTLVHFEVPSRAKRGKKGVYKMRIDGVYRKFQNSLRIQGMLLRCLDEEAGEFTTTRVTDAIKGDSKPMVRVTTASGRAITATREHRFLTNVGWLTLGEAVDEGHMLTLESTKRSKAQRWDVPEVDEDLERWRPVLGWEAYEVSSEGRVRRVNCSSKKPAVGAQGYDVVSLSRHGRSYAFTVHKLVLEAFVGLCPEGSEARHKNSNRADNRLSNLAWGTAAENAGDRVSSDRNQRLVPMFEEIVSVENAGELPTYDLSVEGPWHNFAAGGFVVHNSYNEASARYAPIPDVNYVPTLTRLLEGGGGLTKQKGRAKGAPALDEDGAEWFRAELAREYERQEEFYQRALERGVAKELARVHIGVGRYSEQRAQALLLNWFRFLRLRLDPHAQYEVRVYAEAVAAFVEQCFPRTYALFVEGLKAA